VPSRPDRRIGDPEIFRSLQSLRCLQEADCGMAGRRLSLLRPFRKKKKEGPGAAPFQHPEKMEQAQPLQEGEWDLRNLLEADKPWCFFDCLVESEKKRVVDFMWQALPYLESPQEPLQELALRFIGIAGRYMRGQRVELQVAINVIEDMTPDSAAVKSLALQTQEILRVFQRPQSSPGSSSLKISSRRCRIGTLLSGAAAEGQQRTDPGNPV
ncbi:uncharacterized protein LOC113941557, partial [Corapipo altera]|uniref:uncharacterized protein LOC113941557 n=1 Tax=Corapipo altera TaxID=415028 RepID=UPI000FD647EE